MNQPLQSIVQHLFQVSSLDDVSRQRLESFVEEYPSFGIGHYLLSHKLRTEDPDRYRETTQRTCLYFSNPFWLQWQLANGEQPETIEPSIKPEETIEEATIDEPLEQITHTPETTSDEPLEQIAHTPEATIDEPLEHIADAAEATTGESADSLRISAADQLLLSIEEAKGLRESLLKTNEDLISEAVPQDKPIQDREVPFVLDEPEEVPAPTTPDLVFEPYHTIDYFASQGIRLTLDENPGDALGKQLKSFTEWLKIMRRLPQKDRDASVPDRAVEQAIQTFAAHSIQSKDIVTETMAEVLIMQGMRDRARVIYEKLSLLNPDKKAYFAAKIEQLNIP